MGPLINRYNRPTLWALINVNLKKHINIYLKNTLRVPLINIYNKKNVKNVKN